MHNADWQLRRAAAPPRRLARREDVKAAILSAEPLYRDLSRAAPPLRVRRRPDRWARCRPPAGRQRTLRQLSTS